MSDFEHKPGTATIFKNDFKKAENQPDYRGQGCDLNGNPFEISLWIKDGAKGKFFSAQLQPPYRATNLPKTNVDEITTGDLPF